MFNMFDKTDTQIQKDVMTELKWDPSVSPARISVTAEDGIITLHGTVPHYSDKTRAEVAAQRVGGVRAVADELEVNLLESYIRSDEDIAKAAATALEWSYQVPSSVSVTVDRAWIYLRGETEWEYQRQAARNCVSSLMGVRGVTSEISLKSKIQPSGIKIRIEEALKRSAESDAQKIKVEVAGTQVTLSGTVHSFSEIEDARFAAWSAPGVMSVENDLRLSH